MLWDDTATRNDPYAVSLAENVRALDKVAKQRATLTEVVTNLNDSEAAEPLLDKRRSLATQKQRLRQARQELEAQQRE